MISFKSPHPQRPRSFRKGSFVYGGIQQNIFSREKLGLPAYFRSGWHLQNQLKKGWQRLILGLVKKWQNSNEWGESSKE